MSTPPYPSRKRGPRSSSSSEETQSISTPTSFAIPPCTRASAIDLYASIKSRVLAHDRDSNAALLRPLDAVDHRCPGGEIRFGGLEAEQVQNVIIHMLLPVAERHLVDRLHVA